MSENNNNEVLKTSIGIDFGQAEQDVKSFSKKVDDLANNFRVMSGTVKDLKLDVATLVQKQLDELSDLNSKTNINISEKLKQKIESAIAKAIVGKEIDLVDSDGNKLKYNFQLSTKQIEQLNNKITKSFVSKFSVDDFESVPVSLTKEHQKQIRKRFSEAIEKSMSNEKVIKFSGLDPKKGMQFTIDAAVVDNILNTIQNKFNHYLSQPDAISLEGLKPIKVDSKALLEVTEKIKNSIVSIDKHLNIDPEQLEKLPDIDAAIRNFRDDIRGFVKEVIALTSSIEAISVGTPKEDVMELYKNIQNLQIAVKKKVSSFVKEASDTLMSVPLGTIDFTKHKRVLGEVTEKMEGILLKQLEILRDGMFKGIGLGTDSKKGIQTKVAAMVEGVSKQMEKIAVDGMVELFGTDVSKLDTTLISEVLKVWTDGLSKKLLDKVVESVVEIEASLMQSNNDLFSSYVMALSEMSKINKAVEDQVRKNADELLSKILDFIKPNEESSYKDLLTKFEKEFPESLSSVVSNQVVDLLTAIEGISSKGIDEDKKTILENAVNKAIKDIISKLLQTAENISSDISKLDLSGLSDSESQEFYRFAEDSMREVVEEFKNSLTILFSVAKFADFIDTDVKTYIERLKEEESNKIISMFNSLDASIDSVVKSIQNGTVSGVEIVKQNIDRVSEILGSVDVGGLYTAVNKFFKTVDDIKVGFETGTVSEKDAKRLRNAASKVKEESKVAVNKYVMDIDGVLQVAVNGIEQALYRLAKGWNPGRIEIKTTMMPEIKKTLKQTLDSFGDTFSKDITASFDNKFKTTVFNKFKAGINSGINSYIKAYVDQASKALGDLGTFDVFSIKTTELHNDLRAGLAKTKNMLVRDFTKDFPVLSGEEGLKAIAEESMRVIFKRLNDVFNVKSKELIDAYKAAYKEVTVTPDKSVVQYTMGHMESFQKVLIQKLKQVINEQFGVVIKELRGMKVIPASIGVTNLPSVSKISSITKSPNVSTPSVSAHSLRATSIGGIPAAAPAPINLVGSGAVSRSKMASAIQNTIRYITAGAILGVPMSAVGQSWEAFKNFGYEFTKATQNVLTKYRGENASTPFEDLAKAQVEERYRRAGELGNLGISEDVFFDPIRKQQLIDKLREEFEEFATEGIIKPLQELGIQYALDQSAIGTMYQISTRIYDSPYEALAQTMASAKIAAVEREEIDPTDAALGLEAVASQWGLQPLDKLPSGERAIDKYTNMILKASLLTQATAKDIIETQQRSGGVFRSFLPSSMPKERQFATSVALSAIFTQATGRSGSEAGTFWRTLWAEPFKGDTASKLVKFSQSTDPVLQSLNPYEERYGEGGFRYTTQKSGYEVFTNILNAYEYLKTNDRQREANDLLSIYAKNRNFGSLAAIQTFIDELNKSMDASGVSGLDDFIDKIVSVMESEIDEYIGGLSTTPEFKMKQLNSAWQASTYGIYKEIMPEMSQLIDSLIGFLRKVEKNAETIAGVLEAITKTLIGFGLFELGKKAKNAIQSNMYANEFAGRVAPMMMQRQELMKRRSELSDKYNVWSQQYQNLLGRSDKDNAYREKLSKIDSELAFKKTELELLNNEEVKKYVNQIEDTHNFLGKHKYYASSMVPYFDFSDPDNVAERYIQRSFLKGMSKPADLNIAREVLNLEKSGYKVTDSNSGMLADYGDTAKQGFITIKPKTTEDIEKIKQAADVAKLIPEVIEEKGKSFVKVSDGGLFEDDLGKKVMWSTFVENLTGIKSATPIVIGNKDLIPQPKYLDYEDGVFAKFANDVVLGGGIEPVKSNISEDILHLTGIKRNLEAKTIAKPSESALENMEKYKNEIAEIDAAAAQLDGTMDLLKKAFSEMGVDSKKLEDHLSKYAKALQQSADLSNLTQQEVTALSSDIEKLNRQYKDSVIYARQYVQATSHVDQASSRGTDQTVNKFFSKIPILNKLPFDKSKGLFGGVVTKASLGPMIQSVSSTISSGAGVLISTLYADALMQAIGSSMLTDAERQSHRADNLKKMYNLQYSYLKGDQEGFSLKNEVKKFVYAWNTLKYGMAETFGDESAPSFYELLGDPAELFELTKLGWSQGQDVAIEEWYRRRKEEMREQRKKADIALGEEQRQRREEALANLVDIDGDGIGDVNLDTASGSLESISEELDRLSQIESQIKASAELALSSARATAAISGERQDSDNVLSAYTEYYDANIEAVKDYLTNIEAIQEAMIKTRGEFARQEEGFLKLEEKRLEKQKELNELYIKQLEVINMKFQEIDARYNLRMTQQQSMTTQGLANLYVGGIRKDSEQYLRTSLAGVFENLKDYQGYVEELESVLSSDDMTAEQRQEQESKVAQAKATMAQLREQVADIEQSIRLSPLTDLTRDMDYSSKGYDILRSQLTAKGYSADSAAVRMIQKQQLEDNNKYINRMIADLQEELSKLSDRDSWQAQDLLKQIRDLEAQAAQNIANIYTLMNNTASWGLPSDIMPMTNYEYATSKNSERAIAVQQGNVTVSVKFDTVYARSEDEIKHNIVDPIKNAIEQVNRDMTTRLNRQAQSYVSNYR